MLTKEAKWKAEETGYIQGFVGRLMKEAKLEKQALEVSPTAAIASLLGAGGLGALGHKYLPGMLGMGEEEEEPSEDMADMSMDEYTGYMPEELYNYYQ